MRFLHPEMALWLLLLPLLALLLFLQLHAKKSFRQHAGFAPLQTLSQFTSSKHDIAVLVAFLLVSFSLVLAIMQPQIYFDNVLPEYERQDLVLILDRSVSMRAQDIQPSRLVKAIKEIKAFIKEKPDEIDRISLVGFAGTSIALSYLTRDMDALSFFLDWTEDDPGNYFGTDIAKALSTAHEMINKDTEPTRKIFVLLSDGDDQSEKLAGVLDDLRAEDIRVHTIGIGSENIVPIPVSETDGVTQYLENEEGEQLTTYFNESALRLVAAKTRGSFSRSNTGDELSDFIIQVVRQERHQVGLQSFVDYRDMYVPLLIFACAATFFLFVKV